MFGENIMLSFRHFLDITQEAVSSSEIMGIANTISNSIEKEHDLVTIKLVKNITTSPQVVLINQASGNEQQPDTFPSNLLKNLATNYKFYFGKKASNIQDAEALLFEFPSRQTFIVFLAQMQNGSKYAAFNVPPDYYIASYRKKPIASSFPMITRILQQYGYKVHAQANDEELTNDPQEMEFFNKLLGIFRIVSSMKFDFQGSTWAKAKDQYVQLQQEMPKEYQAYKAKLMKVYGSGVAARRILKLPSSFQLMSASGTPITIEEAVKNKEKVMYPNRFEFSQWTHAGMDPSTMDTAFGGGSGSEWIFSTRIPADKIVYSQKIMPTGLTQLKVEGEIIVDHNPGQASGSLPKFDKDLICEITPSHQFKWSQEMEEGIRKISRIMR